MRQYNDGRGAAFPSRPRRRGTGRGALGVDPRGHRMIRFWCECGRQLQATAQFIGQEAVCPACGRATIVPASDQPTRAVRPEGALDRSRHAVESGPPAASRQAEPTPEIGRRSSRATVAVVLGVVLGGLALLVVFSVLQWGRHSNSSRAKVDPPTADEPAVKPPPPPFTAEQLIEGLSDEDADIRAFAATRLS